jgi:polar amino acid transport system substrate-binding protein
MHSNLKRLATFAAAAVLAVGVAQAKDWKTVRIAMDATYPPFESLDPSGNIVGFDKDIADALCAQMKVTCEFTNQAWDGIIPGLLANKYDAILSSMSITEERKQQIDFTEKYYNTPPAIAVPVDSPLKGVTPDDLKGITIGAQTSTTHAT